MRVDWFQLVQELVQECFLRDFNLETPDTN